MRIFRLFLRSRPIPFEALAGGIVGAFFAFAGWWEVSRIAGEVRDAEKNLPKALAIGVILLTLIYVSTSAVFMYLVPAANVTSDETFAAQAGEALFGAAGGKVFAAIVIVSVVGTLLAYLMAASARLLCDGPRRAVFRIDRTGESAVRDA